MTRAPASSPVANVQVFRPGSFLALGVLLVPILVALSGAAIYLETSGSVPFWAPLVLLIWVPLLPALWFTMQSVRTSPSGIAVGRPWGSWRELAWEQIERAERIGPAIRIRAEDGRRVAFAPMLLQDGARLQRQLLLRLPAHTLAGSLSKEAQAFFNGAIVPGTQGGYIGTLQVRARSPWLLALSVAALMLLALAAISAFLIPQAAAIAIGVICALCLLGLAFIGARLARRVLVNEKGITVVTPIFRRQFALPWEEIDLIEYSPRQFVMRARSKSRRLIFVGPALILPAHRALLWGLLYESRDKYGFPILQRTWVI